MKKIALLAIVAVVIVVIPNPRVWAAEWLLRLDVEGLPTEGKPLYWDKQKFVLLARDGRLWELSLDRARGAKRIDRPFQGFTGPEMRAALTQEFRSGFDVSSTGHYLVVHPAGQGDLWPARFEQLYREMLPYFAKRGIATHAPEFPLVAVVFPSHGQFLQYAHQTGTPVGTSVLGFYDPVSNRILLYDVTAGGTTGRDWRDNAETIVHEAAHQTAFNCGIHSRYSTPPRWVCEGLGTLFEARGVYDSSRFRGRPERVNRQQLDIFRRSFPDAIPDGTITAIVASDRIFQSHPSAAYAASWALTFMLAETEPHKLSEYLRLTAAKTPFRKVPPTQRLRDFQSVFGSDVTMLEARLYRFMGEL